AVAFTHPFAVAQRPPPRPASAYGLRGSRSRAAHHPSFAVALALMPDRAINPLVEQFRKGGVPRELRLMAAQGALPLKTVDLVELLHHLLRDVEPEISASAE